MDDSERCPRCGGVLKAGVGEGLCAHCLLAAALRHPAESAPDNLSEPGAWLGQYRIVRLLGEGGMGMVYLAEQKEPIVRQVALKVIKLGMDTRAVLARFRSEQQALALMDHPNIAQVYEAGLSTDGRPYFAMEYVPGLPITDYCDRQQLDTRQRLELFLQVAQAVQHAHQKGVIHRDLKPSNVLVMERDGEAVPKVIDFGLAKAIEKHFTDETIFTETGVMIGTPEYMSPEQASMGGTGVDTRTDIYSLGVLLYELLVGAVPFDSKALRRAGYDEIRRVIREEDPPTPAMRLLSLGAKAAEIAQCRATEVAALGKQVRGELDWITMKALEKDCARRYPSASEMAADIQHYLRDEPVGAGPAGAAYRLGKFVRKNRLVVGAGTVVAVCLVAGLAGTTVSFVRAERQRVRAELATETAERQRARSENQRMRADNEATNAERQRQRAIIEAARAERERIRAEREAYAANLSAAELLLQAIQPEAARKQLLRSSPAQRGWEWRYLWHESDSSLARLPSLGTAASVAFPSVIGFAESRICRNTQSMVECWQGPDHRGPDRFSIQNVLGMSADGSLVATGGDVIGVVEVSSGRTLSNCAECEAEIRKNDVAARFSPDGSRVAVSLGNTTFVWEVRSGKALAKIPAGDVKAFSPDGQQLALGDDLQLWDLDAPHKIASLEAGPTVLSAVFSPTGDRLAASAASGSVRVWNLKPLSGPTFLATQGKPVFAVAFSPDGRRIAAAGEDQEVRVWLGDRLVARLRATRTDIWNAIAFSPDGTRLAAGSSLDMLIWDAVTYGGRILPSYADRVAAIAAGPYGGILAVGLKNGRVEISRADGTIARGWQAHHDEVLALAFSPDGKALLTGSADGTARLWDPVSGAPGGVLIGHKQPVAAVAFSPDGTRLATGSTDQTARVWDSVSGRALSTIKLNDPVNSVAFSPNGESLLIGSGKKVGIPAQKHSVGRWSIATSTLLMEYSTQDACTAAAGRQCPAFQASFDAAGERVLAGSSVLEKNCTVWNARTGAVIAKLPSEILTQSAIFSPDGSRIVTVSGAGPVRIWDATSYELLLALPSDDRIVLVTFSPDGSLLLGITAAGNVRTWQTTTAHPPPTGASARTSLGGLGSGS